MQRFIANIADIGMIYWLSPYLLLVHNNRFSILNEVTITGAHSYIFGSPVLGDCNTVQNKYIIQHFMQAFMSKSTYNVECSYPTHIKILVESGIDNTTTSSNISTIPITILIIKPEVR
jgi:hypothetical protein